MPDRRARTLQAALDLVVADARRRGVGEDTVRRQLVSHGRYLVRQLGEGCDLRELDRERVEDFVVAALGAGRSPNTLVEKDLPLLGNCLQAVGLSRAPVQEARNRPRKRRREMAFFTLQEAAALIRRVRSEPVVDRRGRVLELAGREWHGDLLQLVAQTGVRAGELARIANADVDWRRRRIAVLSKDRSNPRRVVIAPGLEPVVRRLCLRARRHAGELWVPGGASTLSGICAKWKRRLREPRLSVRALRHTFITGVLAEGASLLEAMELAGHRNATTTDRYLHALRGREDEVAGRLDRWFGGALQH